MIQLNPAENFAIVRGLEDHTDATTYYVQAVIRNALSDAIIETVNLADQGDGFRFMKSWQVPQDPKGGGFYIEIITSVYTDSGYATKATGYGDKYDTYLIMERMNPNLSGGGGIGAGGPDISYKRIEKIVKEVVNGRKMQEINLETLHNAISEVKSAIVGINIPEQEKVDLSTLHDAMMTIQDTSDNIINAIDGIEIPKPEKVDLEPIISILKKETKDLKDSNDIGAEKVVKDLLSLTKAISGLYDELKNAVKKMDKPLSLSFPLIRDGEEKEKKTQSKREFLNR